MSPLATTAPAALAPSTAGPAAVLPASWADAGRQVRFEHWLASFDAAYGLLAPTLRLASADASFRRYLRLDTAAGGSYIVMDAPPALEDCTPFVRVAGLMAQAGLKVPVVFDWNQADGFLLLEDLGQGTMIDALDLDRPEVNRALFIDALEPLLAWQLASKTGVLPSYDQDLLRRELELFPQWYIARYRGVTLDQKQRTALDGLFSRIIEHNLASPKVYTHRDFMPRNLMPVAPAQEGAPRMAVLDFQDAVYGPISYDIASLMRDAFVSWDEEFVLDITVRYWQRARAAGLPVDSDFGSFYRAVEWMGLQRHLKVAGIFARLSLRDGKPRYLADAPRFIAYIRATCSRYRELTPLLRLLEQVENTPARDGYLFSRQ
jgi:aminoglycoside/choline kinase family phosphotransferase